MRKKVVLFSCKNCKVILAENIMVGTKTYKGGATSTTAPNLVDMPCFFLYITHPYVANKIRWFAE